MPQKGRSDIKKLKKADESDPEVESCPFCNGTGETHESDICEKCAGFGWRTKYPKI